MLTALELAAVITSAIFGILLARRKAFDPVGIFSVAFLVAFGILLIRLFIQLIGFVRLFLYPEAELIGVPKIESVDEQAQHEIDAGLAGEEEKVDLLNRNKDGGAA